MQQTGKLSAKLVGIQVFFLAVALVSIGLTLLVSWRLEGSAAAINDAGSLRMRTYRLAYLAQEARPAGREPVASAALIRADVDAFEAVVATLRTGDPARPLVVPRTDAIAAQFAELDREWKVLRPALVRAADGGGLDVDRSRIEQFVAVVNALVGTLEQDIAQATSLLRTIQLALVALAIIGAVALIYLSFLFIIRPVHQLEDGLQRMAKGDFDVRLPVESKDEFGALAKGFNHMAEELEESYRTLERRVADKTQSLAQQNARLATLYDMTALLNAPSTQEDLCRGFLRRLLPVAGAAAGAVRLMSPDGGTLHLFVEDGLAPAFNDKEHCLARGECACGEAAARSATVVHVLSAKRTPINITLPHCREAGFATVAAFPIAAQQQVLGIFNLFYREARDVAGEERHLFESLGQNLGVAIESLRLVSRERELAIAEERNLLAQELHDSIAQSLAFLNLQTQMLRKALVATDAVETQRILDEIQAGVQESYADVRELLVHFRTRIADGDVELGVRTLLTRFQHQTGIATELKATGAAAPLAPDDQLQVMHILQEALSNVRKHSGASKVEVVLNRGPGYSFAVRDDGRGFDPSRPPDDAADHVGLRIMRERATRIGARVDVDSAPGSGTEVRLRLPVAQREAA
ncbi:MAG TPA: type IV pili methyl-accepting chemotaxis transducer N-terminal domain-containing protein [Casimicrobiaceae bacterium]|nr:type IV pili methyl-accepting chemotaxis transducer N-terminal domain-containing protein [Casimicrobiaceae bacterium]